jgi:hypothetical protein
MFKVQGAPFTTLRHRCLHVSWQSKMKLSLPSPDCCNLNEDAYSIWTNHVSWVLADIITEYSHCFKKCDRNWGWRLFAQNFEQLIVYLSTTVIGESIWKQWQFVFLEQSPGASFWIQVVAMQILASYITIFEVKLQSSFMSSIMSWRYWALSILQVWH